MDGNRQIVGGAQPAPYARLVYVFVALQAYGSDRFFILAYESLRDLYSWTGTGVSRQKS